MNNNQEKIKDLNIDELIRVVFILIAIANIFGDELEKKYYNKNDLESEIKAKKIFIVIVAITLAIYIYLAFKSYKSIKKSTGYQKKLLETRHIGVILIILGTIILLYFEINYFPATSPDVQ